MVCPAFYFLVLFKVGSFWAFSFICLILFALISLSVDCVPVHQVQC
ncbi:putative membrane protein [Synechococcus sp. SYN20]|nr:putative membrane protein [Synechococcus sp. SYN20]